MTFTFKKLDIFFDYSITRQFMLSVRGFELHTCILTVNQKYQFENYYNIILNAVRIQLKIQ